MDNQMLSAHITIIADTLNHIDTVLTITMILLTISTTLLLMLLIYLIFEL